MNSIRSEHVRLSQSFNLQPLISSKKNPFSERNLFVITLFWDLSGWNSFQVKSGNIWGKCSYPYSEPFYKIKAKKPS